MATQLQLRRGSTATRTGLTPADGEPFYDQSEKALYVGDGTTAGGNRASGNLARGGFTPGDPSGTTSTTGLMMGIGGTVTITPEVSGAVIIYLVGSLANNTGTDGAKVQLRYGTGTAPANGAALTGTVAGSLVEYTLTAANQKVPFALVALISGLTLGTAYWFDFSLAAITGGTANAYDLSAVVAEQP